MKAWQALLFFLRIRQTNQKFRSQNAAPERQTATAAHEAETILLLVTIPLLFRATLTVCAN
jgi:hypothetical protein